MKKTDLILVCPAKFGGWMMKNPSMVSATYTRKGITKMLVANSAGCTEEFYTKDPDDALAYLAELIAMKTGRVSLETSAMRDLIVPRAAYFGDEEDEDDET